MEERGRVGLRAVRFSLLGNVLLAIVKVGLGFIARSVALISDGIDTAVDVAKTFIVYRGTKIAATPADREHPYGHGRAETISSAVIGGSVVFAGATVIVHSIENFGKANAQSTLMLAGASISILGKIALSTYMFSVGKRINNSAIMANARDYLGDVFSSVAVLLGALLIKLTGKVLFDSIASIGVALIIVYMGLRILREAAREVMEEQDNPEIISKVEEVVARCAKADNPHRIRASRLGPYYIVDMHIEFPPEMSVKEAHEFVNLLERNIKEKVKEVSEVIIHIEPFGNG